MHRRRVLKLAGMAALGLGVPGCSTTIVGSPATPAGRPIQTTRDLPGFWAGNWRDVAKKMRGRYPRHPWPEDPREADPTLRAKRRGN